MKISKQAVILAAFVATLGLGAAGSASAGLFDLGIPGGWTCLGNCGASGTSGVVTLAPPPDGGTQYGWVSTAGGVLTSAPNNIGFALTSETNGSRLTSNVFSASAGDNLRFLFNYVTSDGGDFTDYAYARLLDGALNPVAVLFNARTVPAGNTVPGNGLPPIVATITPPSTPIIPGAPIWSPLGVSSGTCFDDGCGYTGWIQSDYVIPIAGNYAVEFGVVNWLDGLYQTGMAFDGITIAGAPILPPQPPGRIPEPGSLALLGLGLVALLAWLRRKTA